MIAIFRRWPRRITAVCAALILLAGVSACSNSLSPVNPSDYDIEWADLVVGSGTEARAGRGASTFYTVWLYDETKPEGKGPLVQTNVGGSLFSFIIGIGQVIAGWDIGVPGMKVGGTRRLVIPPQHAYGGRTDVAGIPANSTLVYEIQLAGVY